MRGRSPAAPWLLRGRPCRLGRVGVVGLVLAGLVTAAWVVDASAADAGPATVPRAGAGPAGELRLTGSVPALPSGSRVLGPADGTAAITVDVSLNPPDPSSLEAFADAVS